MIGYGNSGDNFDFFVYDALVPPVRVWNGSTYVTWVNADYQSYRVTATELGDSGIFHAADIADAAFFELRERANTLATSYVRWQQIVSDGDLAAIKAKTDLIGTGSATVPVRLVDSDITLFNKEQHDFELDVTTDYTAYTDLDIAFEYKGDDVAVLAHADLTITSTKITFTIPAAVTNTRRTLEWSLRDADDGNKVLLCGRCFVLEAAYYTP